MHSKIIVFFFFTFTFFTDLQKIPRNCVFRPERPYSNIEIDQFMKL